MITKIKYPRGAKHRKYARLKVRPSKTFVAVKHYTTFGYLKFGSVLNAPPFKSFA